MVDYKQIFKEMLQMFGPQGWWPSQTDWETLSGAILVQNTNWRNAEKSLCNLRQKTQFDPQKMLGLSLMELKNLIRPSGFYNAKARTIQATLEFFQEYQFDFQRLLSIYSPAQLRKMLLTITGIGNETADVLLLYIFEQPVFIADNYAKKLISVLEQRDILKDSYLTIKKFMEQHLAGLTVKELQEFHALIDEHGADYLNLKYFDKEI
ncbi:hypothetical protein MOO45_04680 [Bombilactobacillus folatiphilus]|uniref:HhH-GPD domain-containing protein n=1 Tax=Bombilactobacillus folatiphilus TaxID=2923362 RepID=A0ABY4P7D7_9LACO|nr:hypothetical protein [Bombilactobacillus folatiphilus]UQS81524.1 hypothetical protein MOO45_04680 [Bombilactobacillus folatiphilus]